MIEKPKKERRFLKTLGKIGEILLQEVLLKVGSNLIKRIGGKKTLPLILFLFLSISLFAQYPATGNKQRLGYQTTGDGLVYRGRASDTVGIKSSGINNAYFILDTVNNILYNYIKTKGGWKFSNGDTVIINYTVDTTSLSNRINLKVNISDTASMLLPYLRKADTAFMLTPYFKKSDTTSLNLNSRFATKLNISDTASMLTNYLRSSVAALTYLPLTGGTLTGALNVNTIGVPLIINSGNSNTYKLAFKDDTNISRSFIGASALRLFTVADTLGVEKMFISNTGLGQFNNGLNVTGVTTNISSNGVPLSISSTNNNQFKLSFNDGNTIRSYIGADLNKSLIISNNLASEVANISITGVGNFSGLSVSSATNLTGALTVNNATVLNEGSGDFDTRIESDGNANMVFVDASTDRVGIGTGSPSKTLDINGEVRIATVTATPTALLGKDGSNVVGEVTDINQSGVMKVGSTTQNTSSVGIINVAHGLSYTPTKVIATIAQQSSYVIVCHGITSTNLNFTIYDSTDGTALNNVSVGFFWIAFK